MAEAAAPATAPEAKPKRKLPLLIGITVGVLLLVAGGVVWYLQRQGGDDKAEAAKVEEPKLPAQYVALDPPFVVNFERGASARFLQVTVQLMTRDPLVAEFLKAADPVIRNDLLLLFGGTQVDQVATREGKEALRAAALDTIRKILAAEGQKPESLEAVYFTSFVMQ